jgi:hypothetical protein
MTGKKRGVSFSETENTQEQTNPINGLLVIKARLRKKFRLLANDELNQDNLQDLKDHVQEVQGIGKAETDQIFTDLI